MMMTMVMRRRRTVSIMVKIIVVIVVTIMEEEEVVVVGMWTVMALEKVKEEIMIENIEFSAGIEIQGEINMWHYTGTGGGCICRGPSKRLCGGNWM